MTRTEMEEKRQALILQPNNLVQQSQEFALKSPGLVAVRLQVFLRVVCHPHR